MPANYLYESIAAVVAQRLVHDGQEQRKAVFGFLANESLQSLLDDCVQNIPLSYDDGLENQRMEGISLGYLPKETRRISHA